MSNINGLNPKNDLTDGILTDCTTNGTFIIKCDDNTLYDLQTPNNGNNTDVLTTDGIGNTYWSAGGGGSSSTFQDVYNNSSNPAEIVLVNNKPIIFKDTLDQVAFTILSDGITTQAGGFIGGFYTSKMNQIKRADELDTQIQVIEDIPLTTVRTTFTDNQEFVSKLYVDNLSTVQDFQSVYNASSSPAKIEMVDSKIINYTRNDNPILTLDSFNYKLTSQDVSVAKITSNNYFPPNSNNANTWSLSPYNFVASASSTINGAHEPGTSFSYVAVGGTDGWISDNNKYDLISGLPTGTAASTIVGAFSVIGEWLQLQTSIAVAINGLYYGGLGDTSESNTAVEFQLVGSNNGVNFTVLTSQIAQNIIYPGQQYTIPTTSQFLYYRFIVLSIKPNNLNGRCAVGCGSAFDIIPTNPAEIRLLDDAIQITGSYLTANNFIKQGGTNQQYLMADGSSLQYSANSGNSNFYLYNNTSGIMIPPPSNGQVGYNNAVQNNATIIYISHRTRDTIDIDVFLALLTTIEEVYIQDQENSLNFIRYNITANPTIIPNNYISIPVISSAAAGTGLTNFGNGHNLLVSFFTNSIEVDTRLTSLETTTQYINLLVPNGMAITSPLFAVKNLSSYLAGVPLEIGASASSVDIMSPNFIVNNILADIDNTYDLGYLGNSFRRGYFSTALRCPSYDAIAIPLLIGNDLATAVNIGKSSITTSILGTTNINSVYTLPNTAPVVGQVITCGSLGVANWITPSVGAFSFVYPYPTANRTVITAPGTRTLCNTYTMTSNITFSTASLFFPITGSDVNRVGIYRGDLTTATLVGQTTSNAPSSGYTTRPITAVVGQSLTFTVGQQIVIAFTINGGTTSIATTTGISNLALAFISPTAYSAVGFPATINLITLPAATTIRKNIDLY